MPIKSIKVTRQKSTFKGQPCTETFIKVEMQEKGQQPTMAEALELLAEGIKMVVDHSRENPKTSTQN